MSVANKFLSRCHHNPVKIASESRPIHRLNGPSQSLRLEPVSNHYQLNISIDCL